MKQLALLFKLAYAASALTFIFAIGCPLAFALRWAGWGWGPFMWLGQNAGHIGYAALSAMGACAVLMYFASTLTDELQAEKEKLERDAAGLNMDAQDCQNSSTSEKKLPLVGEVQNKEN